MLVLIVKSGERWMNSRIVNASLIVKSGERWINSRIDNASFNSEVRGKMDKQSY
jgi:hypothetical protein